MTIGACVLIQHWAMSGCIGVILGLGANLPHETSEPAKNLMGISLVDMKCPDLTVDGKKWTARRMRQWTPNQFLEYGAKQKELETCAEIAANPIP